MRRSYMDYAMSVIIGRALPDVRDGLKPSHRRVLFAMRQMGLSASRPYRKCAKIVGEVIGNYHPHGDAPAYDTLVRLAQDFNMRYPLVDGQGNFGSVDGDRPAAYRYTEAKLEALAEALMADLDKDTVDFVPNFDETTTEPTVLPTPIPNLLVNGSSGIAVGMATNIPPHNLTEVVDGIISIADPEQAFTVDEDGRPQPLTRDEKRRRLAEHITGPDFPTGGILVGRAGIASAYATGRGTVIVRARTDIEPLGRGTDRQAIIVTEIPYQVNKAKLIERIADLVRDKTLEGISDIRDESDRQGMRIVIELKRGEMPDVVLNNLYKHTPLQSSFGIIMLAIVDGRPRVLPILELVDRFVEFRREVVRRRTEFELRKAEARAHILEGLRIAARQPRRRHHADSRRQESRRGPRGPDDELRPVAGAGAGDPRHAAAAPDRPRAPEDPRRTRRAADRDRAAAFDPRQRTPGHGDRDRRAQGSRVTASATRGAPRSSRTPATSTSSI